MDSAEIGDRLDSIEQALRLLRTPLPPRCLSVKEVAGVLGLSPPTVQGLINVGDLPALRLTFGSRKVYRVQLSDLNAFIAAKKKPSEIEGERVVMVPNFAD